MPKSLKRKSALVNAWYKVKIARAADPHAPVTVAERQSLLCKDSLDDVADMFGCLPTNRKLRRRLAFFALFPAGTLVARPVFHDEPMVECVVVSPLLRSRILLTSHRSPVFLFCPLRQVTRPPSSKARPSTTVRRRMTIFICGELFSTRGLPCCIVSTQFPAHANLSHTPKDCRGGQHDGSRRPSRATVLSKDGSAFLCQRTERMCIPIARVVCIEMCYSQIMKATHVMSASQRFGSAKPGRGTPAERSVFACEKTSSPPAAAPAVGACPPEANSQILCCPLPTARAAAPLLSLPVLSRPLCSRCSAPPQVPPSQCVSL